MNEQIIKHLKTQIRSVESDLSAWKITFTQKATEAAEAEQMVANLESQLNLLRGQLNFADTTGNSKPEITFPPFTLKEYLSRAK